MNQKEEAVEAAVFGRRAGIEPPEMDDLAGHPPALDESVKEKGEIPFRG